MAWDHCTAIIDGEECGKEDCATVHMTLEGHDFTEEQEDTIVNDILKRGL